MKNKLLLAVGSMALPELLAMLQKEMRWNGSTMQ